MTIHLRQTAASAVVALLSLSLGACARAGAQAPCSSPACRVYLPLADKPPLRAPQEPVKEPVEDPRWRHLTAPDSLPTDLWDVRRGAGGMYARGDRWEESSLWFRDADGGWSNFDGRDQWVDHPEGGPGVISISPDGHAWIADTFRLIHAGPDRRRIEVIQPDQLAGGFILAIATAADGSVWVGSERGLAYRDPGGTWGKVAIPTPMKSSVRGVAATPQGGAWVAVADPPNGEEPGQGGLVDIDADGKVRRSWTSLELAGRGSEAGNHDAGGQWNVVVAADGRVYSTGAEGLIKGDGRGRWEVLAPELGGDLLLIDRRGFLWSSTSSGDLARADSETGDVEVVRPPFEEAAFSYAYDIALDLSNGDVCVLGYKPPKDRAQGFVLLRYSEAGTWTQVPMNPSRKEEADLGVDLARHMALSPSGDIVLTTYEDRLLVRSASGTYVWEPQDRLARHDILSPDSCVDPEGRFWLPHRTGVSSFRPDEGWRHKRSVDGLPPMSSASHITCAPDGALWLVDPDGDDPTSRLLRWIDGAAPEARGKQLGLQPDEGPVIIAWSPEGRLAALISVRGDVWNPAHDVLVEQPDGQFRRHSATTLAKIYARDLLWGTDGKLWIAAEGGLAQMSTMDPDAQPNWVEEEAVRSSQAGGGIAWHDGRLWMAGSDGAVERLPDGTWERHLPSVTFTGVASGPNDELWLVSPESGVYIKDD